MKETIYHHKILGEVRITNACRELNKTNPDKTSVFIEYEDETREVTKKLIIECCRITVRTFDSFENVIKEDIIETEPNDKLMWGRSNTPQPTIINSGDQLNICFKGNKAPEEHIQFHNKIVEKIRLSKEEKRIKTLLVENLDKHYQSVWDFSWQKI